MKCQSLFSGEKIKKINLSSAESAHKYFSWKLRDGISYARQTIHMKCKSYVFEKKNKKKKKKKNKTCRLLEL